MIKIKKGTPSISLCSRSYRNSSSSSSPGPIGYTPVLVHPISTPDRLTDTLIICLAAALAIIDLRKGTIQQNNNTKIATATAIIIPTLVIHSFHDPIIESNHSPICLSFPAFSNTYFLKPFSFFMALVNDPSGAVLFGIKVQQSVPNNMHTPLFLQATNPMLVYFAMSFY